jgi:HJR/Mrr/RecB family endonuclease
MDLERIKKLVGEYNQVSGEVISEPKTIFDLSEFQNKVLDKGSFFGLRLKSSKNFNLERVIKEKASQIRHYEVLDKGWRRGLFLGYKVRFDVEALTVIFEEYVSVGLLASGIRWETLENKIFELDSLNLDKKIVISKEELLNLTEFGQKLLERRIKSPAGVIEKILERINQEKDIIRKRRIEDIDKYDQQKREAIEAEIKRIEIEINRLREIDKRAREGGGPRTLEKLAEIHQKIKEKEAERHRLESEKIIRFEKLDKERQESLIKLDEDCELRVGAELLQIGVIEYESYKIKAKINGQDRFGEVIPATEEVIIPEWLEKIEIEPDFEILPPKTTPVLPRPRKKFYIPVFRVELKAILWIVLLIIGFILFLWKPNILILVLGLFGIGISLFSFGKHVIRSYKERIRVLETTQKTITEIDKMSWRDFEKFVANLFEKMGYEVERLGGWGGDYGADLIATNPETGMRYAVQAKKWTIFKVGTSAIKEVLLAWAVYDCDAGIVVTNNYFTERAGILPCKIKKLRVDLWDRDVLIEKIKETSE